ncbi:tetratricopeptide repeat protein [Mangrovimonas aestuarii]|uniref:tetratricopeptide repeat protein n=1 Tax=Mangrovimonas aestuarii TaxID=3018443 RepID=UPI002378A21B|nr:tetratricopeptide repeat protein [Mangrovimonas aestuarii]
MRRILIVCLLLFTVNMWSQDDIIAKEYFNNGEFNKALLAYQSLLNKQPNNVNYIAQLVSIYQQLEQYDEAEIFLLQTLERIKYASLWVELGYNYQLKENFSLANDNYAKAIAAIDENVNYSYSVGKAFEDHSLLEEAATVYKKAMAIKPSMNFNMQLARIYGEQGDVESMFTSYIDFVEKNPKYLNNIKRAITDFISEDGSASNNVMLKRALLKKIQDTPNLMWNEMLSWLFVQQKEYYKAFIQEQAIFNRQPESLSRVEELGLIAVNDKSFDIAEDIFTFLVETAQDMDTQLEAQYQLLQIQEMEDEKLQIVNKTYLGLFNTYGKYPQTIKLQVAYGHFLAFKMHKTSEAITFLKESLELPLSEYQQAQVKLELGDILVFEERFNEALIYYTQIQRNLKNSTLAQEARYRVAKTSYYKGDFKWAESQLKILKSSTSQLIANDALDLMLLISDNKFEDSTQTALKLYAKADLMAYQNKPEEAIRILNSVLENHKTETIMDQALFKQAQLFKDTEQYQRAADNYQSIIDNYKDEILADDAFYYLARLYEDQLKQPEKAKPLYEEIIFNYEDSIYFVEARKRFRALRGDTIN